MASRLQREHIHLIIIIGNMFRCTIVRACVCVSVRACGSACAFALGSMSYTRALVKVNVYRRCSDCNDS